MTIFFLLSFATTKTLVSSNVVMKKEQRNFFPYLLTFPKVESNEHGYKWLQIELCREQDVTYLLTNENNVADQ
jgi:hypothetical protein